MKLVHMGQVDCYKKSNLASHLTTKQRETLSLAKKERYYNFQKKLRKRVVVTE